jgi:integrase
MIAQADIDDFFNDHSYGKGTRASYERKLKEFDSYLIEKSLTWEKANTRHFREWVEDKNWAPNTCYLASCAVRAFVFWKYGAQHDLNRLRYRKHEPGPQRTMNIDQVEKLVEFIAGASDGFTTNAISRRNLAIVAFMLDTGARNIEVCNMKLQNLDIGKLTANLLTKGAKWQQKVFSTDTQRLLVAWLEVRPLVAKAGVDEVFVSIGGTKSGEKLTTDGMRRNFRRWGEKSGVGKLSPHDMRRTMAVLATEAGAPSRIVQMQGGWSDIRYVERYTKALDLKLFRKYSPVRRVKGI